MTDKNKSSSGGCMCGAVRYEAIGEPMEVGYCHCHSCRRHTGAPVVTFVVFKADHVRFSGHDRKIYNSSPGVKRAFCGRCGTPLTWEGVYREHVIIEFHISTLDDSNACVPTLHWFHNERIKWFDVSDNLPRYWEDDEGARIYRRSPATEGSQSGV